MNKILNWLNDNHWYIVAIVVIGASIFWTHGCESTVPSLINPDQLVNRATLQNELNYIVGQVEIKVTDLNRQDEIKQALFDAMVLVSQGGQVNTLGIVNLAATIGAISFGLNRNQKLKKYTG